MARRVLRRSIGSKKLRRGGAMSGAIIPERRLVEGEAVAPPGHARLPAVLAAVLLPAAMARPLFAPAPGGVRIAIGVRVAVVVGVDTAGPAIFGIVANVLIDDRGTGGRAFFRHRWRGNRQGR